MDKETIPDASKIAISKAKEAAEAVEVSRAKQMQEMLDKSDERNISTLSKVLENVFGPYKESGRFIDAAKIPLMCLQINEIKDDISDIKDTHRWLVRIVIGTLITGFIGLLFIALQTYIKL